MAKESKIPPPDIYPDYPRNQAPLGRKFDQEKPRWSLLPWGPTGEIVKVLTFGSKKYEDHNWQFVPEAEDRYFSAAQRHLAAWIDGEKKDPETGLSHLAHAGCCILFLLWFELKGDKHAKKETRPTI
jgi:hypothetical protein